MLRISSFDDQYLRAWKILISSSSSSLSRVICFCHLGAGKRMVFLGWYGHDLNDRLGFQTYQLLFFEPYSKGKKKKKTNDHKEKTWVQNKEMKIGGWFLVFLSFLWDGISKMRRKRNPPLLGFVCVFWVWKSQWWKKEILGTQTTKRFPNYCWFCASLVWSS